MGDRANIYVVDRAMIADDDNETQGIYLYTHWNGSEWPDMLRRVLALPTAKRRWTDTPYLLRILIDGLYSDIRDEETGGGISTMLTDNEYPITVVDLEERTVFFAAPGTETDRNKWRSGALFADYIAQERADYPKDML